MNHPMATNGLLDTAVEMITLIVVVGVLLAELSILLLRFFPAKKAANFCQHSAIQHSDMRPAVFLFLFGVDFSIAFIPLHMENLYQPLLGLPKDLVLGLPISAMFLCVSISLLVSGIWLDRRGWHEPFLVGVVLTALAKFYAGWAPSALHFIAAMGLVGLGYGLTIMAAQGFVITYTTNKNKAHGLAYLFAGFYAGSICGTAIGAMLAERIGYRAAFLLSGVIVLLTLSYTLIMLRKAFKRPQVTHNPTHGDSVKPMMLRQYWNFLSNRHILALVALSSLPSAIAVVGFLNYFSPIYLDRLGFSESIIGSVLVVYCLCMVYLGPPLSRYIDASGNQRPFIIIGSLVGSAAFISYYFFSGIVATGLAVVLLGLSSGLVLAAQPTYALTLGVSQQLGPGRALGIFQAATRIGQVLGPILFGLLMAATDIKQEAAQGVAWFGMAYLVATVLFVLATSNTTFKIKQKDLCYGSTPANS